MTTQHPASAHSTPLNHPEESALMNLDILARLETHEREAEVRHHLDERSLERAANRRRQRTAESDADATGLLSRIVGWLAPYRVARAGTRAAADAVLPRLASETGRVQRDAELNGQVSANGGPRQVSAMSRAAAIDTCPPGTDCGTATAANRAA